MMSASLCEACSWTSRGWKRPRTPMRTSRAIAWGLKVRARKRRMTALPGTRLILQAAEHAARGDGRGGSGHRMNSDKEQKLGLVCRDHGDDETITGSGARMGARSSAGFHKSASVL